MMNKVILFVYYVLCTQLVQTMDKNDAHIAAYLMSVANMTARDYRIHCMVQDAKDANKLKRKPLYVVPPRSQKIFENDLSSKEILFLKVPNEPIPQGYLFIENLYDEEDCFYLHLYRFHQDKRATFCGALKKRVTEKSKKEKTTLEPFDFTYDPQIGSTTMVSITFNDNQLENMEVSLTSNAGVRKKP